MTPDVSVIIPNYNRAGLIGQTLENMLSQTLLPSEIIVVDDGSTDNSVEVIRQFGSSVTLIEQKNAGPGVARNRGLEIASGEFVQFMDSDDLASLNKLEVQAGALRDTNSDICFGPWAWVSLDGRQIRFSNQILQDRMPPDDAPLLEQLLGGWSTILQSLLFRRSFLKKIGNFSSHLWLGEDMEYLGRQLAGGARTVHSNECLTFYRANTCNKITIDARDRYRRDRCTLFGCLLHSIEDAGRIPGRHTFLNFELWMDREGVTRKSLDARAQNYLQRVDPWEKRFRRVFEKASLKLIAGFRRSGWPPSFAACSPRNSHFAHATAAGLVLAD
jgi:glycosyltransferase involved in cell wall biosynthesis